MLVNKTELARVLKTSVPTINAMIVKHGDRFPCVEVGGQGKEWQFDTEQVVAFVEQERARVGQIEAERDELLQQLTLPTLEPEERALTANERLAIARTAQINRVLEKEAGFLVPIAEVRALLTDSFSRLRRAQILSTQQVLADHNAPEPMVRSVISRIEDDQRRAVAALQHLLDPDLYPPPNPAGASLFD